MKKMTVRGLGLMLSLIMLLASFSSVTAFAASYLSSESELMEALKKGGNYEIKEDFNVINSGIMASTSGTIKGNGKTLFRGSSKMGDAMIYTNLNVGKWMFESINFDGNKQVFSHTDAVFWMNSGDITFKNVLFKNFKGTKATRHTITNAGSTLTLENVTFRDNENFSAYFTNDTGVNTTAGKTILKGNTKVNIYYCGGQIDVSALTEGCRVVIVADTDSNYNNIKNLNAADSVVVKTNDDKTRTVTFISTWEMSVERKAESGEMTITADVKNSTGKDGTAYVTASVYNACDELVFVENQTVSLEKGKSETVEFFIDRLNNDDKIKVLLWSDNMKPISSPTKLLQYNNILVYTRTQTSDYVTGLSNSVHFAYSKDGINYTPLFDNYGMLFCKLEYTANNGLDPKCIADPYIFRFEDDTFGIVARRMDVVNPGSGTSSYMEDDNSSKGQFLFWHSEDLVNFTEPELISLNKNAYVRKISVLQDNNGDYYVNWQDEKGNFYKNLLYYSDGAVTVGKALAGEEFTLPEVTTNLGGIVSGNTVAVGDDFLDALLEKEARVENIGVEMPENVVVKSAEDLKNIKAAMVYSDGSTHEKEVEWDITDVNFALPGRYTVTGTVKDTGYPFPVEKHWGDPVIMHWNNKYYFIATNDLRGNRPGATGVDHGRNNREFEVREADSIEDLFNDASSDKLRRAVIFEYTPGKYVNYFWAPEFHVIDGELYLFFTVCVTDGFKPQSYIMKLKKGGDVLSASDWGEPEKVVRRDGTTPLEGNTGGITLDMTYFETNGTSYVVWSYRNYSPEDTGSMLYIATVDKNMPWKLTSDPVLLSRPEYGWEHVNGTNNNEGPAVIKTEDKIYMTYSGGSASADTYAIGLFTASPDADLLDINNWTKAQRPHVASNFIRGEYGPGHNSFFVDEKGDTYIVYHAKLTTGTPSRDVGIRRVHFGKDNVPVFDMSRERDIKDEFRMVEMTVVVDEDNLNSDEIVEFIADSYDIGISYIAEDITLKNEIQGVSILWEENDYISKDGKVTRGEEDTEIELKATFSLNGASKTRTFPVTVAGKTKGYLATFTAMYEYDFGAEFAEFPSGKYTDNVRTDVMHYALSEHGEIYSALNNNKAVLSPVNLYKMGSPSVFRKPDGTYALIAAVDDSSGQALLFDSEDLIFFENQRLITLNDEGIGVKHPKVKYDNESRTYSIYWVGSDGNSYVNETKDFEDISSAKRTDYAKPEFKGLLPEYAQKDEASSFELTGKEYDRLLKKLGRVYNTGIEEIETIVAGSGETITLPEKIRVEYNDGSYKDMGVVWDSESCGLDLENPSTGTYTLQGKIQREDYASPLALCRADPYIVYNEQDNMYYFTASYMQADLKDPYSKLIIRKAETINALKDAGEIVIWDNTKADGHPYYWAPELHYIGGKWRMIVRASVYVSGSSSRQSRCVIFTCEGGDMTNPNHWVLSGAVGKSTDGRLPGSFDTTFFEYEGQGYFVSPSSSSLWIAKMDMNNPTVITSEFVRISKGDVAFEHNTATKQTIEEGSSVLMHNGKIFVLYASATVDMHYGVSMIYADLDSNFMDPASWKKYPYPLLATQDLTRTITQPVFNASGAVVKSGEYKGTFGPGHNSITVDRNGNYVIVYHARDWDDNYTEGSNEAKYGLNDPGRHAYVNSIHFGKDGFPICNMTKEEQLAPEFENVTVTVQVR